MLTRLEVDGFKNLRNVDVYFGPFTCVVGYNAAGKSNLFDAIHFLSLLADRPFGEAAELVRGTENERTADPRDLFSNGWDENQPRQMKLAAEMIVPPTVEDDLGQEAEASITFLRYEIELGYDGGTSGTRAGRVVLLSERLSHITQGDAASHLPFPHSPNKFRKEVVHGRRSGKEFISTEGSTVQVHQDGGSRGKPLPASSTRVSTSVLSTIRTQDSPTILAARREMQQWRRVALEPSAMRSADRFSDSSVVGSDGRHIPAALFRLAEQSSSEDVLSRVSSRLNDLSGLGIDKLWVDEDSVRELLTLRVRERSGATVPARSLSEGTLRFLALCTMLEDDSVRGVLCMEEPENGLHPENVPAMVQLLKDIAVDASETPGKDNPFRQVIVNTHAPLVVDLVDPGELVIARTTSDAENPSVGFFSLSGTWRSKVNPKMIVGRSALTPFASPHKGQLQFENLEDIR